jgi:hypothetical protein
VCVPCSGGVGQPADTAKGERKADWQKRKQVYPLGQVAECSRYTRVRNPGRIVCRRFVCIIAGEIHCIFFA